MIIFKKKSFENFWKRKSPIDLHCCLSKYNADDAIVICNPGAQKQS